MGRRMEGVGNCDVVGGPRVCGVGNNVRVVRHRVRPACPPPASSSMRMPFFYECTRIALLRKTLLPGRADDKLPE